ncbi:hypothetical protein [Kitasatospora sp. NBC_01302]|uniref:hypothetical protein n=1 Tax=Kitasatospora sp. NBC_01302 TaxID=2903575 RepID=UPI002E121518|nr:hypothetical protein OG294_27710 [Kitasatospora sp. NBC_01302]
MTTSTNTQMDSLHVAATTAIEDLGDLLVRGHLKEHPATVLNRLDHIDNMTNQLRQAAERELESGQWGQIDEHQIDADHAERTTDFAAHTCNCGWCWHAALDYDPDGPIPGAAGTIPSA